MYRFQDKNSADIVLADFDLQDLTDFSDLPMDGQIMHIHFFVRPRPGRTPIATTACSATVRHIVLSRGEIGVYTGGGFMLPRGTTGDHRFGGSIDPATLRLSRSTEYFIDALGASTADVSFSASRQDDETRAWVAMIDRLAYVAEPVAKAVTQPAPVAPSEIDRDVDTDVESDNAAGTGPAPLP
jgi:hypothetical protein